MGMMNGTDAELLACFAREDSQAAFTELVRRHLDLVYSAARRQVGSPQLAEEVAQAVFVDLTRAARRTIPAGPLAAWLLVVTRRTAIDAIRRESRRRVREQAAAELSVMNSSNDSPWPRIEPLLDEAMAALSDNDRSAIVLRYFENKSLREVGEALGASDDAAQKRVSRALEELRAFFSRRGIAVASAALAVDLSAHAVEAAPLALGGAVAAATGSSATLVALAMSTTQKTFLAAMIMAALLLCLFQARTIAGQRDELDQLAATLADLRRGEQAVLRDRDDLRQAQVAAEQVEAKAASTALAKAASLGAEPPTVVGAVPSRPKGTLPILSVASRGMVLADKFVQGFGMTGAEKQTLETALLESRARMAQLAVARSSIAEGPNGALVVTIASFPAGEEVSADLLKTFATVLGPERFSTLLKHYDGGNLADNLGQFGDISRTLTVTRMNPNSGNRTAQGPVRYKIDESGAGVPRAGTMTTTLDQITMRDYKEILQPFAERLEAMPEPATAP
jgi:RNA polymerase sigma factor (sigma-70 family)